MPSQVFGLNVGFIAFLVRAGLVVVRDVMVAPARLNGKDIDRLMLASIAMSPTCYGTFEATIIK